MLNTKRTTGLLFSLISALTALCQGVSDIQSSFNDYWKNNVTEKMFVHTDKDFYIAGEIVWFKLYVVDAANNKPMDLSKVGYVEILDKDRKAILQGKIELNKGTGHGSFYLPVSVNSGVYKFRAYTNWMKNSSADDYFEKPITIINSLKSLNVPSKPARNYDIQFFPEGGDMVQGLRSKLGFRIVDQSGKGVDGDGIVISDNNDTVASFRPLKFGIGNFDFTPQQGARYRAVIRMADTSVTRELPKALDRGYVVSASSVSEKDLQVKVTTNAQSVGMVYLFIHSGEAATIAETGPLNNGTAEFLIDKTRLAPGISHITIFNAENLPVCERLVFVRPAQKLMIQQGIAQEQFGSRKKVHLSISSTDQQNKTVPANLSLSVYRVDSLQEVQGGTIDNYLWLTSDLRGHIESPGYYLSDLSPESDEALDNLMLTQGWRRFAWADVLQHVKGDNSFLPEYRSHIIPGKVTDNRTGLPAPNVLAYLAVPGSRIQLYVSRSDSLGVIRFYTKDLYGPNEIILQTDSRTDSNNKAGITSPFSDKYSSTVLPPLSLSDNVKNLLLDYSVGSQVQNDFSGEQLRRFYEPVVDSVAFFGNPDIQYQLDNYTRFSTMEEVLREYVYEVLVRRQKDNFRFIVADVDNKIFLDDPLTLLDGVPVFDPNRIIKYDPLKVKKIDIVKRKYYYGPLVMNGLVNFTTYQYDPSVIADLYPVVLQYEGLQYQREFYSPVYETQDEISSRLPDFRNVLYWAPDIRTGTRGSAEVNFFTSDIKGKYVAIVQGMCADGKAGENTISFEVK